MTNKENYGKIETYNSEEEAIAHLKEWHKNFDQDFGLHYKVVSGIEANKYPVPKRW